MSNIMSSHATLVLIATPNQGLEEATPVATGQHTRQKDILHIQDRMNGLRAEDAKAQWLDRHCR